MKKPTEMIAHNGFVIMDPIHVKPKTKAVIIDPHTNKPSASKGNYDDHPYRGLVIASCKFFYNGGIRYESELKAGDVALFSLAVKPVGEIIIEAIPYPVVRYSDIIMSYSPSAQESKEMIFERQMEKNEG